MKKICVLLIFLGVVACAEDKDICQIQNLNGCKKLFICPGASPFIVEYEKGAGYCLDGIVAEYYIGQKGEAIKQK